jgi:hypothetical protein
MSKSENQEARSAHLLCHTEWYHSIEEGLGCMLTRVVVPIEMLEPHQDLIDLPIIINEDSHGTRK